MIFNVKLINKKDIADGTLAFYFNKPAGLEFRAGQFADITLINPSETDSEGDTRSLSIASAPYENELMFATRMRDSAFKRVMRNLPAGSEVKLNAPFGDFTLHKRESTPAVFIIGGIGVTPVRSMIAQATKDNTSHSITLFHANRSLADSPFREDFERFSKENANFSYITVITGDDTSGTYEEHGHINADILKRHLSDLTAPIYYLSGPEGMVKAMRKLLIELEINQDNIKSEEFAGY